MSVTRSDGESVDVHEGLSMKGRYGQPYGGVQGSYLRLAVVTVRGRLEVVWGCVSLSERLGVLV